jgi:magnesium-transporting ATPase (P-type)
MVLRGVRLPVSVNSVLEMSTDLAKPSHEGTTDNALQIPNETLRVMVGCQSLSQGSMKTSNGTSVIGDPLEKAVLDGCGWTLLSKDTVAPPEPLKNSEWIKILHRFSFTSKLKRMTAIVQNLGSNDLYALSKGAPGKFDDQNTIQ